MMTWTNPTQKFNVGDIVKLHFSDGTYVIERVQPITGLYLETEYGDPVYREVWKGVDKYILKDCEIREYLYHTRRIINGNGKKVSKKLSGSVKSSTDGWMTPYDIWLANQNKLVDKRVKVLQDQSTTITEFKNNPW